MTIETTIAEVVADVTITANQKRYTEIGHRSDVCVTLTDKITGAEKRVLTQDGRLTVKTVVERLSKAILKGHLRVGGVGFYRDFDEALKAS